MEIEATSSYHRRIDSNNEDDDDHELSLSEVNLSISCELGRKSLSMRERATYLVWRDLTVVLPNFGHGHTKRLLRGISGFAEPGRIMAIMGPSGSGKSTLLDSLAGM